MNEKKLELWLSLLKFVLGTFTIGIITAVINWQIQTREIDLKDKEAEFREMERLGEFVQHALAENVAVRKRFSQYFSTVTRSEELRGRWKEYAKLVELEYGVTESKRVELEKIKLELQKALARGETVNSELEKVKSDLSKTTAELEVTKKDTHNKEMPVLLSKTVESDMIFNLDHWDNRIEFDVLALFSKLSKDVLDPVSENYGKIPSYFRKTSAPKLDKNGRISIIFGIEGIPYKKIACWIKDNTDFDEIRHHKYSGLWKSLFEKTLFPDGIKSERIRVYYKRNGNRRIVPQDLLCPTPKKD